MHAAGRGKTNNWFAKRQRKHVGDWRLPCTTLRENFGFAANGLDDVRVVHGAQKPRKCIHT